MVLGYQQEILDSISTTPIAGMFAEPPGPVGVFSRGADVAVPCGLLIVPGSSEQMAKLPTTAAEVLLALGISLYLPLRKELPAGADYAVGDVIQYVEKGCLWVAVEEAVADGARAFVRFAANGGLTQLGGFLDNASDPGGGATAAALPNARFASSTTGAGFAKVRINLPS